MGRALERVYGEDRERLLAAIGGGSGDASLAEDALHDAALAALVSWPAQGVPRSPAAWLTTTARRKLIDRLRRRAAADATAMRLALEEASAGAPPPPETDARAEAAALRLAATCCDPVLTPEVRVSLALRVVGGLRTDEIARVMSVSEPALAKRLVRARQRIRSRGPAGTTPTDQLGDRRESVRLVIEALKAAGRRERAAQLAAALARSG